MSPQARGTATLRSAARRIQTRRSARHAASGTRLLLSSLRGRFGGESAEVEWVLHPDGVLGRALVMDGGRRMRFPLTLDGPVRFSARVMLLPHDWRDRHGAVRATVTAAGPLGAETQLWAGVVCASDRGRPRGHRVECAIPGESREVVLALEVVGELRTGSVTRAIWLEPVITDPDPDWAIIEGGQPGGEPSPAVDAEVPADPGQGPLISVLTPVHNPPLHMLEEAIASVQDQTYPHWELCLVDDGSSHPQIINALQHHAAADPRIHLARHDTAGGISAATNRALQLATGDYIALLDHDDTLTPDALQNVADHITADPTLDMLYSDEDILGEDGPIDRHPKPGWSPDHIVSLMYTCHLGVYRRSLALELGGFSSRFDGCQDYDFVLRLIERTDRVTHIPRTLYHWRSHAASTASGEEAKPFAYLSQPGAISAHLDRRGVDAEVQFAHHFGMHRIVHRVDPRTGVDLVLAVDRLDGLADAARSLRTQPHPTWQLSIAAPEHLHAAITDTLISAAIPTGRITLTAAEDQTPAQALNIAARAGRSEHVLLMQSPAMGLTHDWLTRLLGYSHQPGIAAAGPIVLAPDGRIQQAGIAMPTGLPLHLLHGAAAAASPPVVFNALAVSGVLISRRESFARHGGLDPDHHELTLIDYCLRATQHHDRVVIVPDVRLRTTGPDPTTNDLPALRRLHHTWASTHYTDPYYNPDYRTDRGDFILG